MATPSRLPLPLSRTLSDYREPDLTASGQTTPATPTNAHTPQEEEELEGPNEGPESEELTELLNRVIMAGDDDRKVLHHFNKPPEYDGSPKGFDNFITAIYTYTSIDPTLTKDSVRIPFTLTYLCKGQALTWAENFRREALWDNGNLRAAPQWGTWKDFTEKLQSTF